MAPKGSHSFSHVGTTLRERKGVARHPVCLFAGDSRAMRLGPQLTGSGRQCAVPPARSLRLDLLRCRGLHCPVYAKHALEHPCHPQQFPLGRPLERGGCPPLPPSAFLAETTRLRPVPPPANPLRCSRSVPGVACATAQVHASPGPRDRAACRPAPRSRWRAGSRPPPGSTR